MLPVAIYTNKLLSQNFIDNLKKIIDQSDICIFTDDINSVTNYSTAILPSMFMEFHKGILIFMNIDDFWSYKERLLTDNLYLYIDDLENIVNSIDRQSLSSFKSIITKSNNILKMVKL